jgi:hypothetical protein
MPMQLYLPEFRNPQGMPNENSKRETQANTRLMEPFKGFFFTLKQAIRNQKLRKLSLSFCIL